MEDKLTIYLTDEADSDRARELAGRLGAELCGDVPDAGEGGAFLRCGENGLSLCGGGLEIRADLTKMLPRISKNNLGSEFLIKAANPKKLGDSPSAVDATAGFGEDSLLLAAAGFRVTLYEYDPVIAALLEDALYRAGSVPRLSEAVSRMELIQGDSIPAMKAMSQPPDIILLDPMFPERKKSSLVKKKFQLLHMLEAPCPDEAGLLEAALAAHPKKIIIKRPPKGGYLAGVKPGYSLHGKAVRYDCIVP